MPPLRLNREKPLWSDIRDFPAVKEELLLRSDEVTRGELT